MTNNPQASGEPMEPTRRGLLKALLGFSIVSTIAGVLTPIIGFLTPTTSAQVDDGSPTLVGTLEDFPPGVGKIVAVNNRPVIVTNSEQGIRVFSAICTHLGCVVLEKMPNTAYIECPCHDGWFNPLNGTVIDGVPPRPLPAYEFTISDGKLYVGEPVGILYGA